MSLRSKILFVISLFLLLSVGSLFLYRNSLLQYEIHKVQEKLLNNYQVGLTIQDYGFEGIRDIYFRKIIVAPLSGDTLATIKNVELKISLGLLLRLKLGFKEIYADSIFINAVKKDSISNYSFLFKKKAANDTVILSKTMGYHERMSMIIGKLNRVFTSNILLRDVEFHNHQNDKEEIVEMPALAFDGDHFKCGIICTSLTGVSTYDISGRVNVKESRYDFNAKRINSENASLPFFDMADSLKVTFDTAHVSMDANDEKDKLPLGLTFNINNLVVNHWRISNQDVLFPNLGCDINVTVGDDIIAVNSGSVIQIAKLLINIESLYQRKPDPVIKLNVQFNTTAENFFTSLPDGMFNTLKGLQASGNLKYNLHFDVNKNHPDDLVFDSELKKENFQIIKYGEEYFPRINQPFIYTAMDRDRMVRSVFIGEGNPMFTSLPNISDYLKNAVLTSEDPSFFQHGGFVEDAFRESIAENIKQGRFARGGSTISMQLVKNVFLSRNKTVSRKLEEALIVWLIEKNHLVSKERMYEIYLNIIEWGPDVYGVGEASAFYFKKHPHDLTLAESIFLAELIPHPKYFKYSFDSTGHLKPYHKGYFDLIGNRLLTREKISQQDLDSLKSDVILKGRALEFIIPTDAIPVDSTEIEEMQIPD